MELGSNTIWWPGLDNHVVFGGVCDGGDHDGADGDGDGVGGDHDGGDGGGVGDGGDHDGGDGDGGANYVFQRGRAEPRDPDQEITKSERLHW